MSSALTTAARAGAAAPQLLVLRALGLGDFLTGVPALRALRRGCPDHRLTLAAPGALHDLVALTGALDELLPTGELAPVPWRGTPPQLAVDLHGNGPASHDLLAVLRPARLVAFRRRGECRPGWPEWRGDEHEVARWCRLVEESLGVPADPGDLSLARPQRPSPAPGAVVVHPGAAYASRRWPADRFAAVARASAGAGHRVVVTGSPAERPLARGVAAAAGLTQSAVLAGRTDLTELAALVADARLVICGDTGVAHLATAFATPSVVLFGPTPPQRWGPPAGRFEHVVLWHGRGVGDPWGAAPDPGLLRISVADVVDAAEQLLERTRDRTAGSSHGWSGPAGPRPATGPDRSAARAGSAV